MRTVDTCSGVYMEDLHDLYQYSCSKLQVRLNKEPLQDSTFLQMDFQEMYHLYSLLAQFTNFLCAIYLWKWRTRDYFRTVFALST